LTLRDNNHLETGMRQYENRSAPDPRTVASIEADVKGGEMIGIVILQTGHCTACAATWVSARPLTAQGLLGARAVA
jgi:hypothetical protein